jgi:hypothetical protein
MDFCEDPDRIIVYALVRLVSGLSQSLSVVAVRVLFKLHFYIGCCPRPPIFCLVSGYADGGQILGYAVLVEC